MTSNATMIDKTFKQLKNEKQKIKLTLDSCILFDYLNSQRSHHLEAKEVLEGNNYDLFITESILKEVRIKTQRQDIQNLIDKGILHLLKEPRMGTPVPTRVPADLSHISPQRDAIIQAHLMKRPGLRKYKILKDFLIAEAHIRNKNDFLLTSNIKDFQDNPDLVVVTYDELN